ncbi:MAG: hypothetical protein U0840_15845 [Gemmataceae bacterium]
MFANRWVLLPGLLALLLVGVWLLWKSASLPGISTPPPNETANDSLIAEFHRRVNQDDAQARELLTPPPVFDEEPVSEAEADHRQAGFFLHDPALRIESIQQGAYGQDGKRTGQGERYTFVTRIQGSTPPLRIRDASGKVGSPARLLMVNPDIVVEIHDGKIRPIRPDLHRD